MSTSKAEQLEEFAGSIGMSKKEIYEFCIQQISDQSEDEDDAADYLNKTLYEPDWFISNLFLHQAWDIQSTIGWLADAMKNASDHHSEFDT